MESKLFPDIAPHEICVFAHRKIENMRQGLNDRKHKERTGLKLNRSRNLELKCNKLLSEHLRIVDT